MTPRDRTFLIEFRDYLASAAYPATTSTIAFSTLASEAEKVRQSKQRPVLRGILQFFFGLFRLILPTSASPVPPASDGNLIDAITFLFPLYGALAENFRLLVLSIRSIALTLTFAVVVVSAYVYWGNLILSKLDALDAQQSRLTAERMAEEVVLDARARGSAGSSGVGQAAQPVSLVRDCVYYSNIDNSPGIPFKDLQSGAKNGEFLTHSSIKYGQICGELDQLSLSRDSTFRERNDFVRMPTSFLASVGQVFGPNPPVQDIREAESTKLYATALVPMLNGYITSVLMGLLGASAFILRSYLAALASKTLHPRDARAYNIRLVLGAVAGLTIGFFLSPGAAINAETKSLSAAITLTGPALAFLAGYAVEVVFGFLDAVARTVFPATK